MNRRFIINHFISSDRQYTIVLSALWLLGVCIGLVLSFKNPPVITSELQTSILAPQSLFGFLTVATPLALTVILLWCGQALMIYPLAFVIAICRGYTAFMTFAVFGSGGWLVRFFLLFPGGLISVLFWLFILRHAPHRKPSFTTDVLVGGIFLFVLFALEHSLISPCLQQIIKYL